MTLTSNPDEQGDESCAGPANGDMSYSNSEAGGDAVALCEKTGLIKNVNIAYCTLFDVPADRVIGRNLAVVNCLTPTNLHESKLKSALQHVATGGSAKTVELSGPDKNCYERVLEFNVFPLQGPNDLLCVIIRDITLRKQAQDFSAEQRNILEMITRAKPSMLRNGYSITLCMMDLPGWQIDP